MIAANMEFEFGFWKPTEDVMCDNVTKLRKLVHPINAFLAPPKSSPVGRTLKK